MAALIRVDDLPGPEIAELIHAKRLLEPFSHLRLPLTAPQA